MLVNGRKFPELILASSITPKDITWLWEPYIPSGSASMIFGPGGTGKSHIAVDIAARVSRGELLPGQKDALPAQNVLIMSAEDEFDRVLVPRLIKAGADLDKIAFPKTAFTLDKEGLKMVESYMSTLAAGIVFVDPIVAYIGGKVDINKANETREFTGGLHQMAMRTGAAIVVVHHARKGQEGADFDRAMGSADFNNAVRSVMYTSTAPNGDKIMRHVKANYSALGPTLGYEFGDEGFHWTGAYQEDGVKATAIKKRDAVKDWLISKLKDGPKLATYMEQSANQLGFSRRTIIRGKVGLAESYLVSEEGKMKWYWRLISDGNETDVPVMGSQWGNTEPEPTIREIHARSAERTGKSDAEVGKRGQRVDSNREAKGRDDSTRPSSDGRKRSHVLGDGPKVDIDDLMEQVWNGR
jgi:AAA domain